MIHDFQVPGYPDLGYDQYKDIKYNFDYVKEHLDAIYGGVEGYSYYYNSDAVGAKRGCLFVLPKEWGKNA